MGFARLAAIGMIALTMTTQTGWGQDERTRRIEVLEHQVRQLLHANQALAGRMEKAGLEAPENLTQFSPYIDVRFPGGSLGELVDMLKASQPRANIILQEGTTTLEVPPFEVFDVTPAGAIWVAKSVVGSGWDFRIETVTPGDSSAATSIVRVAEGHQAPTSLPLNSPSKAWNLRTWMSDDEDRMQGAFAAIQVGLESFGDSPIELKYHEPTGVLMARGNQAQIEFIESIIRAAAASSSMKPLEVQNAPSVIAGSSKRLVEVKGEIAVLEARAAVQQARIDELIAEQVGGEGLAMERVGLAEIEAAILKLRFDQEQLEIAIQNAKKILADYEAKNKR